MNILIINGAAYGQDATYNAVRLAKSLSRRDEATTQAFLVGDGVTAAMAGQKNTGRLLQAGPEAPVHHPAR
ncbi:hypothetical protein [Cryobacterium luteum]|uniref:hypothetical protein n=1 Tax=Cryobacterium luteum TaxID=1424661 RepID=UPI0008B9373C|nr:hypothetical protein [Cryobacterium luteum]SEM74691.1 uncharacterized protein involved in oxidation of intracellular sulfur [Cryobacterium luteum]